MISSLNIERGWQMGIRWIDQPGDLADSWQPELRDGIPLLRPSDPTRAQRWDAVIRWYASVRAVTPQLSQSSNVSSTTAQGDRHSVVLIGREYHRLGGAFSAALQRSCVHLASLDQLPGVVGSGSIDSLLVVAPPTALDARSLGWMTKALAGRLQYGWGIITARDLAGVSFTLAKLHVDQRHAVPRGSTELQISAVHAIEGAAGATGPIPTTPPEEVIRTLGRDWDLLSLHFHGDGSHGKLPAAVLCGLMDEEEVLDGHPVEGGCKAGRSCKKVQDPEATVVVPPSSLRARILSLLSCNSFSVCGEMYPSNTSLLLSAADGYPAAILASFGQPEVFPRTAELLELLLREENSFGEIVALLNDHAHLSNSTHGYLLWGDPAAGLGPGAPAAEDADQPSASVDAVISPTGFRSRTVRIASQLQPRCVGIDGQGHTTLALRGKSFAVISGSPSSDLEDRQPAVDQTESELTQLFQRLRAAAAVERGMALVCRRNLTPDIRDALVDLARARRRVEDAAWNALTVLRRTQWTLSWTLDSGQAVDEAKRLTSAWDQRYARVVSSGILETAQGPSSMGDATYPALLHCFHRSQERFTSSSCPRCRNETIATTYVADDCGLPPRRHVECVLCGPLLEALVDGSNLEVELNGPVSAQTGCDAVVRCQPEGLDSSLPAGHLVFQVRDRSQTDYVRSSVTAESFLDGDKSIRSAIPSGLTCDLGSVKAIYVRGLNVTFSRRVFATLG